MNDIEDALRAANPEDEVRLHSLRTALAVRAAQAGLLDVAFRELDSPVGRLLLAATEHGIVRVAYESEGFAAVLGSLAERISPRVLEAPRRLDVAARELEQYFAGRRTVFDLPLDYSMSKGFRQQVQRRLPEIGYGRTASYSDLAAMVGNPGAVRAVGSACATNPLPVIIPCHRVLRADGGLGGYLGGSGAKQTLLALEQRSVA